MSGHIGRSFTLKEVIVLKEIQLNPQQLEAVSHRNGPMVVLSVVGSGTDLIFPRQRRNGRPGKIRTSQINIYSRGRYPID